MPRLLPTHRFAHLAAIALGALVTVGITGCKSAPPAEETLPREKASLLTKADQIQNEGEDLKDQGMKLRAQGKEGDDLIKQGEQKLVEAERLREKASLLKD
jgi:hypothetical protein